MIIPAMLAAPAAPILLLTQTGHFAAAAFLITTAFYAASCAKASAAAEAKKQQQMVQVEEFTPMRNANSPQCTAQIHPTYQRGVRRGLLEVSVVVGVDELRKLVCSVGWECWSSNLKLNGLMLLVADAADRRRKGVFPFASDRARLLCPSLPPKTAADHAAPREGLAVLTAVGVFELVQAGRHYPAARAAEYRFCDRYTAKRPFSVWLEMTSAQAQRWHDRHNRARDCFEQKNPIIAAVRETASRIEFSAQGMELLMQLPTVAPKKVASAERCYRWLQAPVNGMKLDAAHTLSSPISGCPRLVRQHLLIDREEVVEMDISGAHIAMLTKVFDPAFLSLYRIAHTPEESEAERRSLTALIEAGSVYGDECAPDYKKSKKRSISALNMVPAAQMAIAATEPLLADHRILREVMWTVKKRNHRVVGQWLQRWTSEVMNPSVLALYARSIPSIPIVDGLMIRQRDAEAARDELASRLFASTGVRAEVRVKDMSDEIDAIEDLVTI